MTERNTFVDISDGDQLNEGYFNVLRDYVLKGITSDQTGGSVSGSTDETEIGEVQVAANTVETGILVVATGKILFSADVGSEIKLRAGESTTATSNALKKTISRSQNANGGWTLICWIDDLTFTNLNYINITGTHDNLNSVTSYCESLVVLSF